MVPGEVTGVLLLLFFIHDAFCVVDREHVRKVMAHSVPLLPEKLDGSQNYNDWVSQFECVSKINDWSDREKPLWLRARVSGRAHVAYNLSSHEIQKSFGLCKAALRERFETSSKKKNIIN